MPKILVICAFLVFGGFRAIAQLHPDARPDIYPYLVERFRAGVSEPGGVLFLGNSITFWADWQNLLGSRNVHNFGIPGDHTYGVLGRLDEVARVRPKKVFFMLGINDLSRDVAPDSVFANLRHIVQILRETCPPETQLYLQSILPTNPTFEKLNRHYGREEAIFAINAQLRQLAEETINTHYIDLHTHFLDKNGKYLDPMLSWDGVHLKRAGYSLWRDLLFQGGYLIPEDFQKTSNTKAMKSTSINDLQHILHTEERWVKVHAAEFLLWNGVLREEVYQVYLAENARYSSEPQYRIGIWRVLAQASNTESERQQWIAKIQAAYADENGPDRLHAIETLAKLKVPVLDPTLLYSLEGKEIGPFELYQLWNISQHQQAPMPLIIKQLCAEIEKKALIEPNHVNVLVSSYILRSFSILPRPDWEKLKLITEQVDPKTDGAVSLQATLWVTQPEDANPATVANIRTALSEAYFDNIGLNQIVLAFAQRSREQDILEIERIYKTLKEKESDIYHADLHASAAYMILNHLQ